MLPIDIQIRIIKMAVLIELKEHVFKVYRYGMTSFLNEEGFIDNPKFVNSGCSGKSYFHNYHLYCVPGKKKPIKFRYHTKDIKIFRNYLYTNYYDNVSSRSFGMFSLNKTKTRTLKKHCRNNGILDEYLINKNKYDVIKLLLIT